MNFRIYIIIVLATIGVFGGLSYYRYYKFQSEIDKLKRLAKLEVEVAELYIEYLKLGNTKALNKRFPLTMKFLDRIPDMYMDLNSNHLKNSSLIIVDDKEDDETYKKVNDEFIEFMKEVHCSPKKVQLLVKRQFRFADELIKLSAPNFYKVLMFAASTRTVADFLLNRVEYFAKILKGASNQFIIMFDLIFKYNNEDQHYNRKCTSN